MQLFQTKYLENNIIKSHLIENNKIGFSQRQYSADFACRIIKKSLFLQIDFIMEKSAEICLRV